MKFARLVLVLGSSLAAASVGSAQFISLSAANVPYTQDFNSLATAGTTNAMTIPGWFLNETGGGARDNEQYSADTGGSNTGDTYSYGSAAATDRALGSLQSGTLIGVFGAGFTNNTGETITALSLGYMGEQWRLGTASRTDQLDFQYSLDATSLTDGTWVDVNSLDFTTVNLVTAGAKDGNAVGNQSMLSAQITELAIANGASFMVRWSDFNASGADDGLAIDDFSLTAMTAPIAVPEPSTYAAMLAGLALVGGVSLYRRRRNAA